MRRSQLVTIFAFAAAFAGILLPHNVLAASGTFFGPIVPQTGVCVCATAPDWGCALQLIQNLINAAISFGVLLCIVWIAYGGFSLMISRGSAEARSQARARLLNAVIGMVVILCSWLIVDFVMKVLYDPTVSFQGKNFGPWNGILAGEGDDYCIQARNPVAITSGSVGILEGQATTGGTAASAAQAAGDCSTAALTTDWGSAQKASLFSCIINNESKCQNISTQAKSQVNGSGASAGGRYQVNMSSGPKGQGLNFPACVAVAKANGFTGTTLNCAAAYPKGYSNGSVLAAECRAAQLDPSCNTQVAQYLYQQAGVKPWLGIGDIGGKNQACVNQYGS